MSEEISTFVIYSTYTFINKIAYYDSWVRFALQPLFIKRDTSYITKILLNHVLALHLPVSMFWSNTNHNAIHAIN